MDLGFHFTAQPIKSKIPFLSKAYDFNRVLAGIEVLKEKYQTQNLHLENLVRVTFCPLGELILENDNGCLKGQAQTWLGGPGFHAAAVEYCEELVKNAGLQMTMSDETGYGQHHDFERLRTECFQPYLQELLTGLPDNPEAVARLNWPEGEYVPRRDPGDCLTPLGRYSIAFLKSALPDTAAFSQEFFLWPNQGRGGRYYLNCALRKMWMDCRFLAAVESKQCEANNQEAIELLEKAIELDRDLPFPKREYLELCELNGRTPVEIGDLKEQDRFAVIGYRRGMIDENVEDWRIRISGRSFRSFTEQGEVQLEEPPGKIGVFSAVAGDRPQWEFGEGREMEDYNLEGEDMAGHAKLYRISSYDWEYPLMLRGFMSAAGKSLIISLNFRDVADKDWAIEILSNIRLSRH